MSDNTFTLQASFVTFNFKATYVISPRNFDNDYSRNDNRLITSIFLVYLHFIGPYLKHIRPPVEKYNSAGRASSRESAARRRKK
jgi:hypothetical protein